MKKSFLYLLLVFAAGFLVMLWADLFYEEGADTTEVTRRTIETERAPEAIGPYSQAIQVGNTLYLAGQVGIDPESGALESDSLHLQVWQTMDNIEAVLEAADFTWKDVVDAQIYLTDMDHYERFNEIYASYFENNPPARAVVEVAQLPLDAKIEIKMTAEKRDRD